MSGTNFQQVVYINRCANNDDSVSCTGLNDFTVLVTFLSSFGDDLKASLLGPFA